MDGITSQIEIYSISAAHYDIYFVIRYLQIEERIHCPRTFTDSNDNHYARAPLHRSLNEPPIKMVHKSTMCYILDLLRFYSVQCLQRDTGRIFF